MCRRPEPLQTVKRKVRISQLQMLDCFRNWLGTLRYQIPAKVRQVFVWQRRNTGKCCNDANNI